MIKTLAFAAALLSFAASASAQDKKVTTADFAGTWNIEVMSHQIALVIEPALVLADEPTGNLDSASGQRVITMLRELVDDRGQTVVIVTHDDHIAATADRIIRLRDGLLQSDRPNDHRRRAGIKAPAQQVELPVAAEVA